MTYYIKETSVRQDTWQMEFHWPKNPPKKLWGVGAGAGWKSRLSPIVVYLSNVCVYACKKYRVCKYVKVSKKLYLSVKNLIAWWIAPY